MTDTPAELDAMTPEELKDLAIQPEELKPVDPAELEGMTVDELRALALQELETLTPDELADVLDHMRADPLFNNLDL